MDSSENKPVLKYTLHSHIDIQNHALAQGFVCGRSFVCLFIIEGIYSIHTDIRGQDLLQACKSLGIKIPTLQHFQCQHSSIFCRLMVKGGMGFSNAALVEKSTLISHWMLVHRMIHVLFRWPIHWLLLWE